MLKKTLIALSAVAVLGSVSAASAYEVPENLIGDRYPFLEPTVAAKHVGTKAAAGRNLVAIEDPANRLGDRYPFLDVSFKLAATAKIPAVRHVQLSYDDPANRIGDRYPFLERTFPQGGVTVLASGARTQKQAQIRSMKRKG